MAGLLVFRKRLSSLQQSWRWGMTMTLLVTVTLVSLLSSSRRLVDFNGAALGASKMTFVSATKRTTFEDSNKGTEFSPTNKNQTSSLLKNNSKTRSDTCPDSLHDVAVQLARRYSPAGSPSYQKQRRVFQQIRRLYHPHSRMSLEIFEDSSKQLKRAILAPPSVFTRPAIVEILDRMVAYREDLKNATALLYYSIGFAETCRKKKDNLCTNLRDHIRILIQTEQLPYAGPIKAHVRACGAAPHCLIWDWSEFNLHFMRQQLQQRNDQVEDLIQGLASNSTRTSNTDASPPSTAFDSTLILPTMHHNRLGPCYQKIREQKGNQSATVATTTERPLDVVFFGKQTSRRVDLQQDLIQRLSEQDQREDRAGKRKAASTRVGFGVIRDPMELAQYYSQAKICWIVHAFHPETVAIEWHRLSDVFPSGCLILLEEVPYDTYWTHVLKDCGGVVMANYSEMVPTTLRLLDQWNNGSLTNSNTQQTERLTQLNWWEAGVDWSLLLSQVLDL